MNKKLSIIIPCYNEAGTVNELLKKVERVFVAGWEKEIIVVDDGSTDGTRELLQKYTNTDQLKIIFRPQNGGKGSAVRRGLESASGSYILIQDADLEYDPEDIPRLIRGIEDGKGEVVYGSRNLDPKTQRGSTIPRAGVWIITKLLNALYRLSLTDAWTCYKLFPAEAAGDFRAGGFEAELLFTAALARRGLRIAEVPISYYPRPASQGKKIRYRDGINSIILLIRDWSSHLRRR